MLRRGTAAIPATVPVFEDRYFTFASLQQAANVFLMSQQNQQTHRNSENSIKMFGLIKDH
jgi:hypothetical protein